MKRVIISICSLALVIGLSCFGIVYMKNACDELCEEIEEIEAAYTEGNVSDAEARIAKLEKEWEEKDKIISKFVRYDRLGEISDTVTQLKILVKNEEKGDFLSQTAKIKKILEDSWAHEKPDIKNIF
ncbi:MAG: DUF4363 family protein [Oscillospiraceae bacterium]|nr:DUF4363 family protein [Oscillospiraceae bacterium]